MSYGCHNRAPLSSVLIVQDGWRYVAGSDGQTTRTPVLKRTPVYMSRDCQHTLDAPNDKKCKGCRWQA
jgi:hypothetical protein